jgi:hypothetical protein
MPSLRSLTPDQEFQRKGPRGEWVLSRVSPTPNERVWEEPSKQDFKLNKMNEINMAVVSGCKGQKTHLIR